jgi:hypothetical protein
LFELIDQLCLVNIQELIKINEDYDIKINVYLKMNFYNFKIKKLKLTISIPTFFLNSNIIIKRYFTLENTLILIWFWCNISC